MSLDAERIETITVDSYGTLVDPTTTARALEPHVDHPAEVAHDWRHRSLTYTMIANAIDGYQPFIEINRLALQAALEAVGVDLDWETREEILGVYDQLDVYDDVIDGLGRLQAAGCPVYVLSNGNPAMLNAMTEHADIADHIEAAISVDEIQTFKPDVAVYRHAAARTGTPIDQVLHVAGPAFDVQGAMHAGMQGVWLNRSDAPAEPFFATPSATMSSFRELAAQL